MMRPFDIVKIDHVSVLITDLERSRRFYGGLLGLPELHKPRTFDFEVLWFDLGDQHLHLLLKARPDAESPRHFALRVSDAARARAYFRAHGVETQETTLIHGADRFFIRDPDGNRVSLKIPPPPPDAAHLPAKGSGCTWPSLRSRKRSPPVRPLLRERF